MTLQEAQQVIDQWITSTGVRYFNPLTNMAMLTEEVGEVARILARTSGEQSYRDGDAKKELADELADVLWVVLCLANQHNIDMTAALHRNLHKKSIRDKERHRLNEKLK